MNRLAYRGAIVVPMEVPRIWCICVSINLKVLCLRMTSNIAHTIWGRGQFGGCRCLYFFHEVNHGCCRLRVGCLCIKT